MKNTRKKKAWFGLPNQDAIEMLRSELSRAIELVKLHAGPRIRTLTSMAKHGFTATLRILEGSQDIIRLTICRVTWIFDPAIKQFKQIRLFREINYHYVTEKIELVSL